MAFFGKLALRTPRFRSISAVPVRGMAYNVYEDTTASPDAKFTGTDKEIAESIFMQNAENDFLKPGSAFIAACGSLAREYPELKSLSEDIFIGRAHQFFDENEDGLIDRDEFVNGVQELLQPKTKAGEVLSSRLKQGIVDEFSNDFSHVKKIAIMGAGVAGLQTASLLKKKGFEVTIFEKSDNVGGVWKENYADFGLQVPKELYEFPEYPYPAEKDWELFPPGPQVQEYIEMYAKEMSLIESIKFNTAVQGLEPKHHGWEITYSSPDGNSGTEDFDFLVISSGMYSWPPHIPKARGWEQFQGEILHSCTFNQKEQAAGKKVVVVGGGKSAIDNVVAASKGGAESATLVYREAHWPVPRYLVNLVPFKWGTYSRFGHAMLPTHYDHTSFGWWMHSVCAPLKWGWWRIVETMFTVQFGLKGDLKPKIPLEIDVFGGGQILTYEFRDLLAAGKVQAVKGSLDKMKENSVTLTDGTELEADQVIYGTGFGKSYKFFDSVVEKKLEKSKDGLYLYRNVIPPGMGNTAFVGTEVSTFNNILTHGMQALWLSKVISGDVQLPSTGSMRKQIEKEQAWKRTWMPATSARASLWQLHMLKYHDTLCKDMNVPHRRKGMNFLAELFAPYQASDYRDLFK